MTEEEKAEFIKDPFKGTNITVTNDGCLVDQSLEDFLNTPLSDEEREILVGEGYLDE